jgi:Leucine-rich repeat (LRR) protein
MKTLFIAALLLCCNASSYSQVVRIPDPIFKQQVIALGYDENGDGDIQVSEAQKVTKLYIDKLGIVNLEGINSFINLEELGCYGNKLQLLNISGLKKLKHLYAYNNRIEKLNLGDITKLEILYIQDNFLLAELDISKLVNLKELFFTNNKIKKLDVNGLKMLEKIEGGNNRIETAMVNKAPSLISINLRNNPVKTPTIDIKGLMNLEYFNFEGCGLQFINFSSAFKLKEYHW